MKPFMDIYLLNGAATDVFNWKVLLFGEEHWSFAFEVLVRSVIMFAVSLATLRILGKRGIKQGVFEVVVIITLGSAAGDAMFYSKVGLIPAILVFVMIIMLYKLTNYLVAQNKWFQFIIEGHPIRLIEEGRFYYDEIKKQTMAQDEYLPDLRLHGVTQMGQVKYAFIEASGEISLVFYREEEVKYGLPILPGPYDAKQEKIVDAGIYSCTYCGNTKQLKPSPKTTCKTCMKTIWVKANNEKRIR
jgi:uncharacterized membrane protein YcaP (DUF421 family)